MKRQAAGCREPQAELARAGDEMGRRRHADRRDREGRVRERAQEQPQQRQQVVAFRVARQRPEQCRGKQRAEQVDERPVADDLRCVDVEREHRQDSAGHDGCIAAEMLAGEAPRGPDSEKAENEGWQPQQHDRVRHRLGKGVKREEVERAQLHSARTERRMDEVARLEDRVDLVLPGIELPEPGQTEQRSCRQNEEQRAPVADASAMRS